MTKRIVVRIYVSRYQRQKALGDEYRELGLPGETFTEFKRRRKEEETEKEVQELNISNNISEIMVSGGAKRIDPKSKLGKKKHTPSDISKFH